MPPASLPPPHPLELLAPTPYSSSRPRRSHRPRDVPLHRTAEDLCAYFATRQSHRGSHGRGPGSTRRGRRPSGQRGSRRGSPLKHHHHHHHHPLSIQHARGSCGKPVLERFAAMVGDESPGLAPRRAPTAPPPRPRDWRPPSLRATRLPDTTLLHALPAAEVEEGACILERRRREVIRAASSEAGGRAS